MANGDDQNQGQPQGQPQSQQPLDLSEFGGTAVKPVQATPAPPAAPTTQSSTASSEPLDLSEFGGSVVPSNSPESTTHKLLAGKDTYYNELLQKGLHTFADYIQAGKSISDIGHGDVRKGVSGLWDNEANPMHVVQGSSLEKMIQYFNPTFKGAVSPNSGRFNALDVVTPLLGTGEKPPVDAAQFIDKNKHPMGKALAETAQSFLSPQSIAMIASTGGAGLVDSPAALGQVNRLITAGFSASAIINGYQHLKGFKEAFDKGDAAQAEYELTHAVASGALAALTAQHAKTNKAPHEVAWTKAGATADVAAQNAAASLIKNVADLPRKAGQLIPDRSPEATAAQNLQRSADLLYQTIKPGKKAVADDFRSTLEEAMPQLSVVANKNPNVQTPGDMADAIEVHRNAIEGQLKRKAFDMRGVPDAKMDGIEEQVQKAVTQAWDKVERKYTPDEKVKAEAEVMKLLGLESKMEKDPNTGEMTPTVTRTAPTPDLYGAENIRQRFSDDTSGSYGKAAGLPSAEVFAKQVAGQALRDAIDAKFEDLGVEGVKEWRQQEVSLIDVRDALRDAMKRAEDAGKWSVWNSITKSKGWGALPALAGGFMGGLPGAVVAELGALGADWYRDQQTNPNVLVRKAIRELVKSGPSGEAALPSKTGGVPTTVPKSGINVSENGKPYEEQKFKTSVPVKVTFEDGSTHFDRVRGLNEGHALARAKANWPGATVEIDKENRTPEGFPQGAAATTSAPEHSFGTTELSAPASEYAESKGLAPINTAAVEPDVRQAEIAKAYEKLVHEPNNTEVKASYDALKRDVKDQFELAKRMGIKMDVSDTNPYTSAEDLHNDILNNKHLTVWNGGAPPTDHPLSETDPETGFTYNEMFRMVHDIFGHGAEKNDFSPAGEESAWSLHRQMFSPEARPALATETRGQAAYTYENKDFPEQKAALLPGEYQVRQGEAHPDWVAETLKKMGEQEAGAIDPRTGKIGTGGEAGIEVYPEARTGRERLDHKPTAADLEDFYDQNAEILRKHPELRIGWDKTDAGWELNIGAAGTREGAALVGNRLDQRAAWDLEKNEEIPLKGRGEETEFKDYPLEQRLRDLKSSSTVEALKSTVEAAGGVFKGVNKDGLVEIALSPEKAADLPIDERMKKFVSVTMPAEKVSETSVRDALQKKYEQFGGKPEETVPTIVEKNATNPISQIMASSKGFGTTDNPLEAGFILDDGRMVPLQPGAEHNDMIALAGGENLARSKEDIIRAESKGLTREQVIENEGTIRTRFRKSKAGDELVFSVPSSGVSDIQVGRMKQAVVRMGRYGNIVMEVGDPILAATHNLSKEFATANDVEPMLKKIGVQVRPETVPTAAPKALLEHRSASDFGGTVRDDIHHEIGHAIVADAVGLGNLDGIWSDRHPYSLSRNAAAAFNADLKPWGANEGGFLPWDKTRAHLGDYLTFLMGGGVGEEVFSGTPFEDNEAVKGDMNMAFRVLTKLGFTGEELPRMIAAAKREARDVLTKPGVRDIVLSESGTREENLPDTHHMSKERVDAINQRIRDEENRRNTLEGNPGTNREGAPQGNREAVAGGEGQGPGRAEEEPGSLGTAPKSKGRPDLKTAAGIGLAAGLGALGALNEPPKKEEPRQSTPAPVTAAPQNQTVSPQPLSTVNKTQILDMLERAARDNQIPLPIFRAQAMQESRLDPFAVSNKGARGVMQLMPNVAKHLGVDPDDPEDNIYGGAQLMAQLHHRFGHWDRALAAYDWEPDKVQDAIDSYGDEWLDHTPEETQNYVHRILHHSIQK